MNDESPAVRSIVQHFGASTLLGVVWIIVLGTAGVICPCMVEMFEDFGFDDNWRFTLWSAVQWYWTLPLSVIVATALIWKAQRLSPRMNRIVNVTALLTVIAIGTDIFLTMCFTIRGSTLTGLFG